MVMVGWYWWSCWWNKTLFSSRTLCPIICTINYWLHQNTYHPLSLFLVFTFALVNEIDRAWERERYSLSLIIEVSSIIYWLHLDAHPKCSSVRFVCEMWMVAIVVVVVVSFSMQSTFHTHTCKHMHRLAYLIIKETKNLPQLVKRWRWRRRH